MKILSSIGLLTIGLCVIAGCSKQSLPKPAFKAGIENYYQSHPACLWDSAQTFPAKPSAQDAAGNGYDALVDAGLLTRTAAKRGGKHRENTYQLAAEAQPFWISDPNHPGAGNICYGHRQVVSIDNASPKPTGPGSVTMVSYHYTIQGAPSWSSNAEVQAAFPKLNNNGGSQMSIATMTDTGKGWQMNPPPSSTPEQSASNEPAAAGDGKPAQKTGATD